MVVVMKHSSAHYEDLTLSALERLQRAGISSMPAVEAQVYATLAQAAATAELTKQLDKNYQDHILWGHK
jgi:hypothetical protein